MKTNALLEAALQLKRTGWHVVSSSFEGAPPQMEIALEHDYVNLCCPECGAQCPGYDALEKRWRHLNFFQYRCENRSRVRATFLHRLIDGYWSRELEAVSTRQYLKMHSALARST